MTRITAKWLLATGAVLALALAAALAWAWRRPVAPELLAVAVPTRTARVGEAVRVEVDVRLGWAAAPDAWRVTAVGGEAVQFLEATPAASRLGWGWRVWRFVARYQVLAPGDVELPALVLTPPAGAPLTVRPGTIAVQSALPAGAEPPLALAPALETPRSRWGRWLAASAAALLALALAGVAWHRTRQRPAPPPPTPAQAALAALAAVERRLPMGVGVFYQQTSDILRRYLGEAWHVPAPARATGELLTALAAPGGIADPDRRELLAAFLRESDLVKYARAEPGPDAMRAALAAARQFVAGDAAWREAKVEPHVAMAR